MMIVQYVHADEWLREGHQDNWAKKVINRKDTDFFPDPWAIFQDAIKNA
jgi:hypothetical protein